jgi:hypothetical protein
MSSLGSRKWRMEVLSKKWLSMKEEVAYKKMLICINKSLIVDVGRYLEKVMYNWLNKIKGF